MMAWVDDSMGRGGIVYQGNGDGGGMMGWWVLWMGGGGGLMVVGGGDGGCGRGGENGNWKQVAGGMGVKFVRSPVGTEVI
jgi:hypothetical protein